MGKLVGCTFLMFAKTYLQNVFFINRGYFDVSPNAPFNVQTDLNPSDLWTTSKLSFDQNILQYIPPIGYGTPPGILHSVMTKPKNIYINNKSQNVIFCAII